jgi:hypothetical protein
MGYEEMPYTALPPCPPINEIKVIFENMKTLFFTFQLNFEV